MNSQFTLCTQCKRSCGPERCCWADHFEPVPGWDARQTFDRKTGEPYSYQVRECPQFMRGRRWSNNPQSLNDDGCLNLISALLRHAKNDYVQSRGCRAPVEKYLRSEKMSDILMGLDVDALIRDFRKEARVYEREQKIRHENLWRIWGKNWKPIYARNYSVIVIRIEEDGSKRASLTERYYAKLATKAAERKRIFVWRLEDNERMFAWRELSEVPIGCPDLPEGVSWDVQHKPNPAQAASDERAD